MYSQSLLYVDPNMQSVYNYSCGIKGVTSILFSMYINDIEINFTKENCPSVDIQLINIFLLMYADDMILIAESPQSLQKNVG